MASLKITKDEFKSEEKVRGLGYKISDDENNAFNFAKRAEALIELEQYDQAINDAGLAYVKKMK